MIILRTSPSAPLAPKPEPPAEDRAARLSITVHHPRPGTAVVGAHGELDLSTVDDFRAVLVRAGRVPVPTGLVGRHLVCDLSGVTFLAAVGVGVLAEAGDAARRRGTHLHLVAPPGRARRVLELCGMDKELPIAARLADVLGQRAPSVPTPRNDP